MKKKMNKNLTVGLWLTGIMLTLILVGFFWTPYNPETMDNAAKLSGVSFSHLMGCDNFGRDIFSRVLKGGGTTFCVALGTVAIGTVFGVIIGAFTGYFGGILDEVLMRINDVLFAFPSILLALVFVTLLGGGTWNVIIALALHLSRALRELSAASLSAVKIWIMSEARSWRERAICELCLSISCPIPYRCFYLQS